MTKKRAGPRGARVPPPAPAVASEGSRARSAIVGAVLVAVVAVGAWWTLRTPAFAVDVNADRNVLLVTVDTLRADALGSYGGRASTPNLDRLAARGARFAFAHAHAVVTLPSHASILTGRYPYEHGIRDNTGYRLADTQATAATRLKAQGFATAAFVGGFPLDRRFGLGVGFDTYDDDLDSSPKPSASASERANDVSAVPTPSSRQRSSGLASSLESGSSGSTSMTPTSPTIRRPSGRRAFHRNPTSGKSRGRTPRSASCSIAWRRTHGRR